MALVSRHGRAEVAQVSLTRLNLVLDFLRDKWQVHLDVGEENLSQLFRKRAETKIAWRHILVDGMLREPFGLNLQSLLDGHLIDDVLLRSVLDTDET